MKSFFIITSIVLFTCQPVYAEGGLSPAAGSRSARLIGYALIVGLSRSKANDGVNKKKMRSMIARLSRGLPGKISRKAKTNEYTRFPVYAKMNQSDDLIISSIDDISRFTDDLLLWRRK